MLLLRVRHCSFESSLWKSSREQRISHLKNILEGEVLLSKSKAEVVELLGDEYNHYYVDRWKYFVTDLKSLPYKMYLEIEFRNNAVSVCRVKLV
ncbi:hypothetical protein IBL28_07995 [Sinomicrobium sp. FJxs]|uniref:Uncharacterized protein n=2 Tax=Sinomicrobium weinanense TaxID=2842200 RepID=A0A926JRE5_9FLAO|nr:hypothetical protein [Sinomicrobium weinanense]MBC9795903.1 hypothetical protein [Sinomicrobium weinanense]MBU3124718.1 hypothetical protein [Sinomicrobium weinanense]